MPLIDEILVKLGNAQFFTKIDLAKRFHQIPVATEDRAKTSFITPFGKFQYLLKCPLA